MFWVTCAHTFLSCENVIIMWGGGKKTNVSSVVFITLVTRPTAQQGFAVKSASKEIF